MRPSWRKITGRPVHNTYTRAEDFVIRTHRPQFRNEMHLSVKRDGSIVSGNFKVIANVGAARSAAANGSWFNMQDLYKIPNLKLEAVDVFTNSYKQGPYRCVSHPNGTLALEVTMEKAAYAIGMDPLEFRLKNLNETGNPDTKQSVQQSRHPRLHPAGSGRHRLEAELARAQGQGGAPRRLPRHRPRRARVQPRRRR